MELPTKVQPFPKKKLDQKWNPKRSTISHKTVPPPPKKKKKEEETESWTPESWTPKSPVDRNPLLPRASKPRREAQEGQAGCEAQDAAAPGVAHHDHPLGTMGDGGTGGTGWGGRGAGAAFLPWAFLRRLKKPT